jgi:adenylosuccinate synthase
MPSELSDELGERIRRVGREYGTTTGRPRRVGWFDAAVAGYTVAINGIRSIALTKLDVLDTVDPIRICTAYRSKGELQRHPMSNISHLKHCEPIYEDLPGWRTSTSQARRPEDLPRNARRYIARLEELCGAPIDLVSVGAARDHTVWLDGERLRLDQSVRGGEERARRRQIPQR